MQKKKKIRIDDDCPICGGKIWGGGQKILIEGAKITVCQSCAHHGKKIITKTKKTTKSKLTSSKTKTTKNKQAFKTSNILEPSVEIVSDYPKRLRNIRAKNNLTQEQFAQKLNEKPSLLRRIEAGKVEPSLELAKRIEKMYNVSLLKDVDEIQVDTKKFMKKSSGSSLGDIAFIKRKK
jgi:putative transcription factor